MIPNSSPHNKKRFHSLSLGLSRSLRWSRSLALAGAVLYASLSWWGGAASGKPGRRGLKAARHALKTGDYDKALKTFVRGARGQKKGEAWLGAGKTLMETGRYKQAERYLKKASKVRKVALQAQTELARLEMKKGKLAAARKRLEAVVQKDRLQFEARLLRGRLLLMTGSRIAANTVFKDFFHDLNNGYLKKSDPIHLLYLGRAAAGQKSWQEASSTLEQASRKAPGVPRIWLAWAELAIRKYRVDWADRFYKKVLKINPNHPYALAGMAWVEWYAPRSNHHKGRKMARKALKVNPKCISAMLYLVSLDVFDAKYPRAQKTLKKALGINPKHLRALALKGAVHFLQEQDARFEKVKGLALSINPHNGRFFNLAGKFVSRHHRYADAAKLNKMALSVDPQNADALADLGINQLRTGEYGMGWYNLKEAYKLDAFNHKTVNLLTLHDELPKRYVWHKVDKIKFLIPKDEVKLLSRYVPQVLNRTVRTYIKKYRYTPHLPVYMELYDKAQDFQARTFGEPAETGIMGVCFGKVVTSMSPSLGRTNWAYVLWHELAHVIHVQMTSGKVPRWFTEGLAEYETVMARPEWKREYSRDLYRMRATGTLPSVTVLNLRFTRSKNIRGIIMAYYQSTLIMEYFHKRWGWAKIVEALHAFSKGKDTTQVLREVFEIEPKAFDKAFAKHLEKKLSHYRGQFDPLSFTARDVKSYGKNLEKLMKGKSGGGGQGPGAKGRGTQGWAPPPGLSLPRLQAELAMIYILSRKQGKAKKVLKVALSNSRADPYVRFAQALLHRANRNALKERRLLMGLVKDGHDSYEGRMRLATLALAKKKHKEAITHLEAAFKLDPEASKPLVRLAFIYKKLKKEKPLVDAIYKLAFIKQTSASIVYSAIKRASKLKQWERVRKLGPLGIHNQPFNALIHEKYAWALRAAGKHKEALFEFQSALLCKPKNAKYIHVGIARSHVALGQKKKALKAVNAALDVDPNFSPAVKLVRRLEPDRYGP